MFILVVRAFLQIRKYLLGLESGAFLSKYLFDWVFVFLFFFAFVYSNSFHTLNNLDFNSVVKFSLAEFKSNPVIGLPKLLALGFLWSGIFLHVLILISIFIKYIKLSSFAEPDVNRYIKFVKQELEAKKWKKAFNMLRAKWYLVKENSVLLSYLGDAYVGLKKDEESYGAYCESLEFATNDALKVAVTLKAADIAFLKLKDISASIELIEDALSQPLEESEYKLLESKKAEILAS